VHSEKIWAISCSKVYTKLFVGSVRFGERFRWLGK
jgi:hypothetical protein